MSWTERGHLFNRSSLTHWRTLLNKYANPSLPVLTPDKMGARRRRAWGFPPHRIQVRDEHTPEWSHARFSRSCWYPWPSLAAVGSGTDPREREFGRISVVFRRDVRIRKVGAEKIRLRLFAPCFPPDPTDRALNLTESHTGIPGSDVTRRGLSAAGDLCAPPPEV